MGWTTYVIAVAGALGGQVSADDVGAWRCEFQTRQQCDVAGCRTANPGVWLYLSPSQHLYWRCEGVDTWDNCDQYESVVSQSGQFINNELPGRSAFARIGPDRTVVEVVSLGMGVIVSHGQCEVAPPALIRERR